jgi:uncharacterized protein (DUF1778 family)
MAAVRDRPRADTTVTMRMPVQTKELIDKAAASLGKSRSEFMIESARLHAVDVLLDQRVFNLDPEASAAFMRALDNPPTPSDQLRKLIAEPDPWV